MDIVKIFRWVQNGIAIAVIGWLVFSYADILAHNDWGEEHNYSSINAIVLCTDFCGEVCGMR